VKKGHYWSRETENTLREMIIKYGATDYKNMKLDSLSGWTETEIRLRTVRLFKTYDLSEVENIKF
jgi:hypothetical protein